MSVPGTDRPRLAEVIDDLIDPRVGLLAWVSEVYKDAGAPEFFHYSAKAAGTLGLAGRENFRHTGGAAARREDAVVKAIGEAIERYSSAWYDPAELPLTTHRQADFDAVPPEEFALYRAGQCDRPDFPVRPFTRDTAIRWTPARDARTGAEVHVPAARVYMPYQCDPRTGDTPVCQPISTGLACHESFAAAALSGVCEVIERDAITIVWQAMVAPPHLRVESLPDELYDLVARFERTAAEVTLFDVTLDHGVPTMLSALRSRHDGGPALVLAGAAAPSPATAVRKSLEELAHTRRYSQFIRTRSPRLVPDPPDHHTVTGQQDHLNYWADHANLPQADFLFSAGERLDFDDLADPGTGDVARDLRMVCERVSAAGERVLLTELTTPDVAELGLSVVRAVIPGFHPLQLGHVLRAQGGTRLWTVPQRLGHRGIEPGTGDNPAPHPYP